MNKTEWFSPEVKPMRAGLYERWLYDGRPHDRMSEWNGEKWMFRDKPSNYQHDGFQWRGLAKKS